MIVFDQNIFKILYVLDRLNLLLLLQILLIIFYFYLITQNQIL
jgi:hypothetical protein